MQHPAKFSSLISPVHGRKIAPTYHKIDSIDLYASPETCPPVEYMPLEDMENAGQYGPEGYHPIFIGDSLTGH